MVLVISKGCLAAVDIFNIMTQKIVSYRLWLQYELPLQLVPYKLPKTTTTTNTVMTIGNDILCLYGTFYLI